jgi:cytochrome d ubiquinol oxidase subunit I
MDITVLSRIQFAVTTIFHFLFVPLTIGLSIYVAVFETIGYVKKKDEYNKLARFFGHLFIINYAVGVVTGIVQEFQFGMNWSGYSRFVGDVFGAPLAIEALSAFFLESTFLGVWIFGKNRLPKKVQVLSIWLVAVASNISAYWILVANSFMQEPTGYEIVDGRAVMTDFPALIFNEHVFLQFFHTFTAALVTASCFVVGISAYKLLKKAEVQVFSQAFKLASIICIISVLGVAMAGDLQGKHVVKTQPMKMAAIEALWDTEQPASFSIIAGIDETNKEKTFSLDVPGLLSFLAWGDFNAEVQGINDLQAQYEKDLGAGNYIPPVTLTYWSFRIMIGMAGLMLLVCLLIVLKLKNQKYLNSEWLLKLAILLIPLPYISNSCGWIVTEVGRQPWIVYNLLRVENAVSKSVASGWVLTSLLGFIVIYGTITVITVGLMARTVKKQA